MSKHEQSLAKARLACQWLKEHVIAKLPSPLQGQVACLVMEFERLRDKEARQIEAGRKSGHLGAEYGKRGGRPKGSTKNGGKK